MTSEKKNWAARTSTEGPAPQLTMTSWQSTASCSKSLRVISNIKFKDAGGRRKQLSCRDYRRLRLRLLHSGFISCFLFFLTPLCFSLKPPYPGGPRCLSEAGCFKPQLCSPSAASGLSSHRPSVSGSAECCWRHRQKASSTAARWLWPLGPSQEDKSRQRKEGRECGKNRAKCSQ